VAKIAQNSDHDNLAAMATIRTAEVSSFIFVSKLEAVAEVRVSWRSVSCEVFRLTGVLYFLHFSFLRF
jgi:hypothetical protein